MRIWSLCSDRFDSCLCMGPGTTAAVIDEAPEKSFYYCLVLRSVYRFLGRTESRCFFTLGCLSLDVLAAAPVVVAMLNYYYWY